MTPPVGSLLAGVASLFIVFKVLVVSHFNITTALGIVAESGTASLVVGALIRSLPFALMAVFLGLLVITDHDATPEPNKRLYRRAGWAVAGFTAATQPAILGALVLAVAWMSMGTGFRRFGRWTRRHVHAARPRTKQFVRAVAIAYVAALVTVMLLSDRPWLPAEHMTVHGEPAITGYVLKVNSDEAVILEDSSRQLVRVEAAKVRDRRYCLVNRNRQLLRPVISLLYGAPSYPHCSRLDA